VTTTGAGVADAPAARSGARTRSNIEVFIPTFNEEINLPHALASVMEWADAVYVVDSNSTDRTREIAESMGATVVLQKWLGYARQKNWAIDNLPLTADWTFILDADEAIKPQLRDELLALAARPVDTIKESGFYVNRLTYFMGRPIRHSGYFPSYNLRFFKRGHARYEEREVHEHMVVNGPTARLKHVMRHEDRRGLEHFIAKHNRYSTLEARELIKGRSRNAGAEPKELERGIAVRRWLKYHVQPRLPMPGFWRFLYMYIVRLGFLDGATGFRFALLLATYDFFISLKLHELKSLGPYMAPEALEKPALQGLALREGTIGVPTPTAVAPVAEAARATPAAAPAPVARAPETRAPAPATNGEPAPHDRARPDDAPLADPRHPDADRLAIQHNASRPAPGKWPAPRSVAVSVLVPVKNEQRNIVECLRRLQWASEIVVVDSQSSDPTGALSQAMGADVYQFHYSPAGWPKKKNWALEHIDWKNEWVLILDADEYMTPELAEEIRQVVTGAWKPWKRGAAGCGDGFWLNRRFMFMDRWLKGCGLYPSYNVRLFKHRVGRYERIGQLGDTGSGDNEVHEHVVLSTGEAGYLQHDFLHYAYPDLSVWVEKHNRYTTWEAHAMEAKDEGEIHVSLFGGPIAQRRWLKRFARKLPFRPTLRFFYAYIIQRGFLDGYPGFVMCRLLGWYELMSNAKHHELGIEKVKGRPAGGPPG